MVSDGKTANVAFPRRTPAPGGDVVFTLEMTPGGSRLDPEEARFQARRMDRPPTAPTPPVVRAGAGWENSPRLKSV